MVTKLTTSSVIFIGSLMSVVIDIFDVNANIDVYVLLLDGDVKVTHDHNSRPDIRKNDEQNHFVR